MHAGYHDSAAIGPAASFVTLFVLNPGNVETGWVTRRASLRLARVLEKWLISFIGLINNLFFHRKKKPIFGLNNAIIIPIFMQYNI